MTTDTVNMSKKHKRKMSAGMIVSKVLSYGLLSLMAIFMLVPFLFALSTSFTTRNGIYDLPFKWIPQPITIQNYSEVFDRVDLVRASLNTFMYIIPPIVFGMLCSAMAAFVFSKLKFPGKNIIFYLMLSTILIPGIITLIPSYIMYTNIYNWLGTPLPLIIPGLFGGVGTMFFLVQFMRGLPDEMTEAALIDGANHPIIFFKIILPLSVPALIPQIVLGFTGAYNDYMGPLLYVGTVKPFWTIQLAVANLQSSYNSSYPLMMAGSMIALIPTLILFVFSQRFLVDGITITGLK